MAFISSGLMAKKELERTVNQHPLLGQMDVKPNVKMAYLQGCVLGTLLDDEQVSEDERMKVRRIGFSLGMSDDEIGECFDVVTGLSNDDDKSAFIDELKSSLGVPLIAQYFMTDLEEIMKKDGIMAQDARVLFDFIGAQITGHADWQGHIHRSPYSGANAKDSISPSSTKAHGSGSVPTVAEAVGDMSAENMYQMGLKYLYGRGVVKDESQAAVWCQKAAMLGHEKAKGDLAYLYFFGKGVAEDEQKAFELARDSASHGSERGQYVLACCYDTGISVVRDRGIAFRWFSLAAQGGLPAAMSVVGEKYHDGDGVAADRTQSRYWLRKAADAGIDAAKAKLWEWYFERV